MEKDKSPSPQTRLMGSQHAVLECLKEARSKLTDGSEIDLDYIDEVIAAAENNVGAEHVIEVLEDCKDYFDNRSDADCDQDGFVPNKEMDLLSKVQSALDHFGVTKAVTHTEEAERLRRMVERRDEFIVGKGLWDEFKEASADAK